MGLLSALGARRRGRGYRCFFATDIHGSERCLRKFLAAARVYEVDALILGGDIVGKALVPMRRVDADHIAVAERGRAVVMTDAELEPRLAQLRDAGLYPRLCTDDEYGRLGADSAYRESVFEQMIAEQVKDWCTLAAERLDDSVRLVITPGNDDPFVIDEILDAAERVECPERDLLELGPVTLASLGNVNATPWHTPREFTEEELSAQIDQMVAPARGDARLVFNFHCPPKGSGLDNAPRLDETFKPVVIAGRIDEIPVGSTAVRNAVTRYKPVVGLHGHIHESAGAWRHDGTMCLNPGSDYGSGVLKGAFVVFDDDGSYRTHLLTTG